MNGSVVLVGLALVTYGVEDRWGSPVAAMMLGGFLLAPAVLRTVAASLRRPGGGS